MNIAQQTVKILATQDLQPIISFPNTKQQCLIMERKTPQHADSFFNELLHNALSVIGEVSKDQAFSDLEKLLHDTVPENLRAKTFYNLWLQDMADIYTAFCTMINKSSAKLTLSSQRGCRRYHVDNVQFRLLVTYAGAGTEWINDQGANRQAFINGAPNEEIVVDRSQINHMNTWDIALFRGGPKGLLHRTPDAALETKSVFMRLDII